MGWNRKKKLKGGGKLDQGVDALQRWGEELEPT